jgi:hypothetical protein
MRCSQTKILTFSLLPQPADRTSHSNSTCRVEGVGTTSLDLSTVFAVPDPNSLPLHTKLSTKLAEVLGVLTDLHLLNLFPQTGTVPRAIFANNSGFFGAFRHSCCCDGDDG